MFDVKNRETIFKIRKSVKHLECAHSFADIPVFYAFFMCLGVGKLLHEKPVAFICTD